MKKKQAMDANMAWVVVDLLHSRERERVPFQAANLSLVTSIGVETEPRILSTNRRGMEIVSVPTSRPLHSSHLPNRSAQPPNPPTLRNERERQGIKKYYLTSPTL